MTANKSISQLPWSAGSINKQVNDATNGGVCNAASIGDAAYICCTANVYPKLVAALREWLPADPADDGTQDAAMRALLRELGELN